MLKPSFRRGPAAVMRASTIMHAQGTMDEDAARSFLTAHAGARLRLIAESFARLTGRPLLGEALATPQALWAAPFVLLAHGTEPDPLFFYGDRMGLELFELSPETLIRTPSRLSAEPVDRAERARLLEAVGARGFIEDYAGVRVSSTGRRFRIEQAVVWNLVDADGALHGQAAAFARWTPVS
jgi:hypothetical protein